jgi:N-acyl-D-amino-acid deacylase
LYATHMRDEGDQLLESLDEAIGVARMTGASLQISHFKVAYARNWDKIDDALARIDQAVQEGIDVFCDRYPYTAGSTGFSSFNFPLWALQGTTEEFLARLKDKTLEARLRAYVGERELKLGSWDKVLISSVDTEKNRRFEGRTVLEGMQETGKDAFEFMRDLIIEENNRVGQIIFMMSEDNLKRILAHPRVGVGCDGSALAPYGNLGRGKPHPRSYGTFPRVLGKYIREESILPLPEMIKKMTSVPARKFGFSGRGLLQRGYLADIVVFDQDRVADRATWEEPHQYSEGIEHVIVNGETVIQNSDHTGRLPGRILRSGAGE